jgi:hypothetical protein
MGGALPPQNLITTVKNSFADRCLPEKDNPSALAGEKVRGEVCVGGGVFGGGGWVLCGEYRPERDRRFWGKIEGSFWPREAGRDTLGAGEAEV